MSKIDLTKTDAEYYKANKTPKQLNLNPLPYLQVVGVGAPEGDSYQKSIEAIYQVAYTLKFKYKEREQDFVVPKLETFWWVESGLPFAETPREHWHWKLAMRLPELVEVAEVTQTLYEASTVGENPMVSNLFFAELNEGKCIQAMHVGPYDEQGPTIDKLMEFANDEQLSIIGQHHEIYISDPRKAKPENLKTIIRYAVA
mgnify:CR=1 FL=1